MGTEILKRRGCLWTLLISDALLDEKKVMRVCLPEVTVTLSESYSPIVSTSVGIVDPAFPSCKQVIQSRPWLFRQRRHLDSGLPLEDIGTSQAVARPTTSPVMELVLVLGPDCWTCLL